MADFCEFSRKLKKEPENVTVLGIFGTPTVAKHHFSSALWSILEEYNDFSNSLMLKMSLS